MAEVFLQLREFYAWGDLDQADLENLFRSSLLYNQLNSFMPLRSFKSWRDRETIPLADRILPLIAQRGAQGMTRGEIGRLVDLERDTLDDLLDGLVRFGLLVVNGMNGVQLYRCRV